MTLSALMKKGALRGSATAISATAATDDGEKTRTVARIATVAVASPHSPEANDREEVPHMAVIEDLPPPCWNCGATMAETTDIYGVSVWVCTPCTVSSDVLPDLAGQMLRAWVVEKVRDKAVKICSALLGDHLWLILDRSFIPHDGLAVYYPEELPLLKTKTPGDLAEIHKAKLAFPGSRIVQEGEEKMESGKWTQKAD